MTASPRRSAIACRIRPVSRGDARLLFDWLNRPDSLAASLMTKGPVGWDEHCAWLDERLNDPASRLWIVEADERAVGQVRLQNRGQGPEVSIYVEGDARGRGIAEAALARVIEAAGRDWPAASIIAKVRFANHGSRRLFVRVGFRLAETAADHWVFVKGG